MMAAGIKSNSHSPDHIVSPISTLYVGTEGLPYNQPPTSESEKRLLFQNKHQTNNIFTTQEDADLQDVDQWIRKEPLSPPQAPDTSNENHISLPGRSPSELRFEDCSDAASRSTGSAPPMPILEKYTDIPLWSAGRPTTPPKPILSPQVINGTDMNTAVRKPSIHQGNKRKISDKSSVEHTQCGAKKAYQETETVISLIDEHSESGDQKYHQNQNRDKNDSEMKEKSVQEGAEPRVEEAELDDVIIIEQDEPCTEDSTSESRKQTALECAPEDTCLKQEVSGLFDKNGSDRTTERPLNLYLQSIDEVISWEVARGLPLEEKIRILLDNYNKLTERERRLLKNCICLICKEFVTPYM